MSRSVVPHKVVFECTPEELRRVLDSSYLRLGTDISFRSDPSVEGARGFMQVPYGGIEEGDERDDVQIENGLEEEAENPAVAEAESPVVDFEVEEESASEPREIGSPTKEMEKPVPEEEPQEAKSGGQTVQQKHKRSFTELATLEHPADKDLEEIQGTNVSTKKKVVKKVNKAAKKKAEVTVESPKTNAKKSVSEPSGDDLVFTTKLQGTSVSNKKKTAKKVNKAVKKEDDVAVESPKANTKTSISDPYEDDLVFTTQLLDGWSRKVTQRKSGISKGKYDYYYTAPDGTRCRSSREVMAYFNERKQTVDYHKYFQFSIVTQGTRKRSISTSGMAPAAKRAKKHNTTKEKKSNRKYASPGSVKKKIKSEGTLKIKFPLMVKSSKKKQGKKAHPLSVQKEKQLLRHIQSSKTTVSLERCDDKKKKKAPMAADPSKSVTQEWDVADLSTFHTNPAWVPPQSPFKLIFEELRNDPWKVLLASMVMCNVTPPEGSKIVKRVLEKYSVLPALVAADQMELSSMLEPIDSPQRLAKRMVLFADEVGSGSWESPMELSTIGKYGLDAWRLFCSPDWYLNKPESKDLSEYYEWLLTVYPRDQQPPEEPAVEPSEGDV